MFFLNETKISRPCLTLILGIFLMMPAVSCFADNVITDSYRLKAVTNKNSLPSGQSEIENTNVKEKPEISLASVLMLDLTIPGGGHFYRGDYIYGTAFLSLKMAGAFMVYYYVKKWNDTEDSYRSARNSGLPEDDIDKYRREYDRSAQYVTFAAAMNVLVYGISALINYNSVNNVNESSYPSIIVYFSSGESFINEIMLCGGVKFRI